MRVLKQITAGLLLILGVPIVLMATLEIVDPKTTPQDRKGATAALVLFGLPLIGSAGGLLWNLRQQQRQVESGRVSQLEQTFLKLLQEGNGYITPLRLAVVAEIPLDQAKAYLDEQSKNLNATFEVSEAGGIVYCFSGL